MIIFLIYESTIWFIMIYFLSRKIEKNYGWPVVAIVINCVLECKCKIE